MRYQAQFTRRNAARTKLKKTGDCIPAANIGRNHPDYGMTVAEHEASKAKRKRQLPGNVFYGLADNGQIYRGTVIQHFGQ